MYHNVSRKWKKNGEQYKDYYYYACKHRKGVLGHKCNYIKQIKAETLESAVEEIIIKLVRKPEFANMMKTRINSKVDTAELDKEIISLESELRRVISMKNKLLDEIDSLDPEDKHFGRIKSDLSDRIYALYDKIDEVEDSLMIARKRRLQSTRQNLKRTTYIKP